MATFSIAGNMKLGSQWRDFKKEVTAESEEQAREALFKILGGQHGVPRRFINIAEITDHSIILENGKERPRAATEISPAAND